MLSCELAPRIIMRRHTHVTPIRWQDPMAVASSSMGSSYYTRQETPAKNRYAEKLMSVGLSIEDDPSLPKNGNGFADSLSNWPQTEFGHIFTYFVSRTGVYEQEQLLSWKQMDAYAYFQAGYVRVNKMILLLLVQLLKILFDAKTSLRIVSKTKPSSFTITIKLTNLT